MENLQLFDIKQGAEFIGSTEKAIEIIEMLMLELNEFNEKIISIKNNIDKSYELIHATLGASLYCGTPKIQKELKTAQDKLSSAVLTNTDIEKLTSINKKIQL